MPISEQTVSYRDRDIPLTGLLYWNPALSGRRPGVLLVHGGAGLDDHARDQARRYASLGYAVLACDMLGDGVAGQRERVIACLTSLRDDPDALVRRAMAGLAVLADCPHADGRFAAAGFCFGGMTALALARSGQQLAGVISIHGSLATSAPARPGAVAARVLVCHGSADPHVPLADVTAFAQEMDEAGASWQLIMYGGAQHGFTHSRAVPGAVAGVAYDVDADKRSLSAAKAFLAEIFGA
ncbi:MAG TPA: dienelactone hydrolase family protein [Streptosporangiaceae bacterium]|nr:dienelactone hydrolase family protein [Streptosporangiaceae bacterium]